MDSNPMKTALILGATGAVGKSLLKDVLKNGTYSKVVTVTRREMELDDNIPKDKLEQKVIDFDKLNEHRDAFRNVNDVYCCLGTTKADAGSAKAFKDIDQGYVLDTAEIIKEENKPSTPEGKLSPVHYLYCSSAGANKNSFFLYPKTKGETEHQLANTGFERVSIFRPGFLETEEPRARARYLESFVGSVISFPNRVLNLGLAVPVGIVGQSMRRAALEKASTPKEKPQTSEKGTSVFIYTQRDIENIAKEADSQQSQ